MSRCTAPVEGHTSPEAEAACPVHGRGAQTLPPQASAAPVAFVASTPQDRLAVALREAPDMEPLQAALSSRNGQTPDPVPFVRTHVTLAVDLALAVCPSTKRVIWASAYDPDVKSALYTPTADCTHFDGQGAIEDFVLAHGIDDIDAEAVAELLQWTPRDYEMEGLSDELGLGPHGDEWHQSRNVPISRATGIDRDNREAMAMFADVDPRTISATDPDIELAKTLYPDA